MFKKLFGIGKELLGIGLVGHMEIRARNSQKDRFEIGDAVLCLVQGPQYSVGSYNITAHVAVSRGYRGEGNEWIFYSSKEFCSHEEALAHLVREVREAQKRYPNTRYFRPRPPTVREVAIENSKFTYSERVDAYAALGDDRNRNKLLEYIDGEWRETDLDFDRPETWG